MKRAVTLLLLFSTGYSYSQIESIVGIYQLDASFPTRYYISLTCDSNYHFITHYDFGGKKTYVPSLQTNVKWVLSSDSVLTLPELSSNKKKFKVESDSVIQEIRRKETFTWRKIISYNEACDPTSYTMFSNHGRDVYHFIPNKQVMVKESFQEANLTERITYYELSSVELDSLAGERYRLESPTDPIYRAIRLMILADVNLPIKIIENWKENGYEEIVYNKLGERIK